MTRGQYRMLALALAAFTAIAGLTAYFTSSDAVTNSFGSATLEICVTEPNWKNNPTIVPEQKIDKDPYIVNTDETPAYVFMQVTVPAQEVTLEKATNDNKGTVLTSEVQKEDGNGSPIIETITTHTIPLFRFVKTVNGTDYYTTNQLSSEQEYNTGWYYMNTTENKNASDDIISYTYLYAWTGSHSDDTMSVLYPNQTTDTPLFNKVIFCNAREDDTLPGSVQNIKIEVFGIQTDYLKSSTESESKVANVWKYLSA